MSVHRCNIHLYPSALTRETSIERETEVLAGTDLFSDIVVYGVQDDASDAKGITQSASGVVFHRVRLFFRKKNFVVFRIMSFVEWFFRLVWINRCVSISVVTAHSLSVLPIAVLLKYLHRSKLMYAALELETEVCGLRGWRKRLSKWVERLLIKHVDGMIVVNNSIADWYRSHYTLPFVEVVRNMPPVSARPTAVTDIRAQLGLSEDAILFIYQGILSKQRLSDFIFETFRSLGHPYHLVMLGFGPLYETLHAAAQTVENCHVLPGLPHDKLLSFTAGADMGLSILDDSCLNHKYCLPNKFAEYLNAGLPVLCNQLVELKAIIEQHHCGMVCDLSPEAIRSVVQSISTETIRSLKENVRQMPDLFNWDEEAIKVVQAYKQLWEAPCQN